MGYFHRKLAREALQEESMVPDSVNLESPDENLETQLAELPSAEAELDQMDAAAEVLEDDIAAVETHVDMADEAVDQGEELSEDVVKEIEVAQESIRRRYGLSVAKVGAESFRNGARGVTKVAQESWQDTLKGLWEKFLELCKAAINKVKELKLKYLNAGKSAVSASKKYREMMKKLGTEKSKDEISGDFISKLAINRQFDIDKSIETAKTLSGKMSAAAAGFAREVGTVAEMVKLVDGKAVRGDGKEVDFGGVTAKISQLSSVDNADQIYGINAFPGDVYVQQAKIKKGEVEWLDIAVLDGGSKPDATTIPTPSHQQIDRAISGLAQVGTGFEKTLQDFRGYDDGLAKLEKAAEKLVEDYHKKTEDAEREAADVLRQQANAEVRKYKAVNSLARKVNGNVIKGLNGYIKTAMGAYKKAKK